MAGIVFLAANVPEDGRNALSAFPLGRRLQMTVGQHLADLALTPTKALRSWVRATLCHDLDAAAEALRLERALDPEPSALFFERFSHEELGDLPRSYVKLLEDRALPPSTQDRMASRIGARLVSVDCGHAAMLARPRELAVILRDEAARIHRAPSRQEVLA
jgi:hypothetical protein